MDFLHTKLDVKKVNDLRSMGCLCHFEYEHHITRVRVSHCPIHIRVPLSEDQQAAEPSPVGNLCPPLAGATQDERGDMPRAELRRQVLEGVRAVESAVTQLRVALQRYDDHETSIEYPSGDAASSLVTPADFGSHTACDIIPVGSAAGAPMTAGAPVDLSRFAGGSAQKRYAGFQTARHQ
jgi:hypothetical protein